jgi:hypothetical protein
LTSILDSGFFYDGQEGNSNREKGQMKTKVVSEVDVLGIRYALCSMRYAIFKVVTAKVLG